MASISALRGCACQRQQSQGRIEDFRRRLLIRSPASCIGASPAQRFQTLFATFDCRRVVRTGQGEQRRRRIGRGVRFMPAQPGVGLGKGRMKPQFAGRQQRAPRRPGGQRRPVGDGRTGLARSVDLPRAVGVLLCCHQLGRGNQRPAVLDTIGFDGRDQRRSELHGRQPVVPKFDAYLRFSPRLRLSEPGGGFLQASPGRFVP